MFYFGFSDKIPVSDGTGYKKLNYVYFSVKIHKYILSVARVCCNFTINNAILSMGIFVQITNRLGKTKILLKTKKHKSIRITVKILDLSVIFSILNYIISEKSKLMFLG